MRRSGHPKVGLSRALLAFAGLLVLGLGLAAWALAGIRAQPQASAYDEDVSGRSVQTTAAVVPSGETPLDATPTVSAQPYPDKGEKFGSLTIPVLERTLPIIEGTEAEELDRGVGHFSGSVLPGVADNCVLSGHRDTVFRGLGDVDIGDRLIVRTDAGQFTYQVGRIRIVDKDDRTVIVPTEGPVLTVTTCYPFNYIGSAPDRYILSADLVASRLAERTLGQEQRLSR